MPALLRRLLGLLLLAALAAGLVWAFLPEPVPVEAARVERGSLEVCVEAEGRTAVREPYRVSLPFAGRLQRITLHAGDPVEAGQTVLAVVEPTPPALLDAREVALAEARLRTAEASVEAAQAGVDRAKVALAFLEREAERRAPLARAGSLPAAELAEHLQRLYLAQVDVRSAELAVRVSAFEREQAAAALLYVRPREEGAPLPRHEVRAPIRGVVLRVLAEDEGVLAASTPLLELGDLGDLEVQADVLTRDAVRLAPGQAARLEQWGGAAALEGRVRRIEPAAFTKVSALGVEEQRVRVLIDLVSPPPARAGLGQGYRVDVRVTVDRADGVLCVPSGALFRVGEGWAAFRIEQDRARRVAVVPGRTDGLLSEVLSGLSAGDRVVAYPSDRVADGVRVLARRP